MAKRLYVRKFADKAVNRATDSGAASGIATVILIKTIQAGLFTEGGDWRIKSSTMVSAWVSGFRLESRFLPGCRAAPGVDAAKCACW